MHGYSYDTLKYESQQHINRLADEAAAERLARRAHGESAPNHMRRLRWFPSIQPNWATRLVHTGAHAPIARVS